VQQRPRLELHRGRFMSVSLPAFGAIYWVPSAFGTSKLSWNGTNVSTSMAIGAPVVLASTSTVVSVVPGSTGTVITHVV